MSTSGNGIAWDAAGSGSRSCKFGGYGMQGAGKTTTLSIVARLIAKRLGKKHAYMVDSEGGADYVASLFEAEKMTLKVLRTREFGALVKVFEAMRDSDEIILVDSVTHFWNDVVQSYLRATKQQRVRVQDWAPIFETWRIFTSLYAQSHLHASVCGRMGYEYANAVDEQGKLEFYRVDTKMKAGEQFGHEPDLLLYFEQVDNATLRDELRLAPTKAHRQQIAQRLAKESQINIVVTVEKDRTRLLMARQFVFTPDRDEAKMASAVEAAFAPVVDWHLQNKTHSGMAETGATAALMTPSGNEFEWQERKRRKDFALDEVKETLTKYFPSLSAEEKQAKIEISERVFGVKSWEGICQKDLEILEGAIKAENGMPSLIERACIEKSEVLETKALQKAEAKAGKGTK